MNIYSKSFLGYCFLFLIVALRFFVEDSILGLSSHFFLILHQHYWYFLVLLVCIFWSSVFLKKTFAELYWFVFLMPVIFLAMIFVCFFDVSISGLVYLNGADFSKNMRYTATFLLGHKEDLPISIELISIFVATLFYSLIVTKSVWKSFANAVICHISVMNIGTLYVSPSEKESLFGILTSIDFQMWMAFKYMSYAFIMIFVLFRHEIIGFYKSNRRFRISGIILFASIESVFIALFGIRPYLQNHYFYFADIFVTFVPSIVVSQTLNLLFFTKIKDFVFRKLFLAFHSLIIFMMILFYLTGWYLYIGHTYKDSTGMKANAVVADTIPAENTKKKSIEIYDTIIVGGGLAGLKAAYDLRDLKILLLEKEARIGGRVLTERCGKNNLDFCELGALFGFSEELIPEGFEIGEKIPANKKFGFYMNGNFYTNNDVISALRAINPKDAASFDEYYKTKDINRFMRKVSEYTRKAVRASFNTIHPGDFDKYSDLRKCDAFETFRFNQYVGGNSALIEAYGVAISNRFLLNSEVQSVESQDGIVTIQYTTAGQSKEIKAKSVIVATPANVTQRIVKNMSKNTEKFLKSVRYGGGAVVVFEIEKKKSRDLAYLITPDNSFNTVSFNNTIDGKGEVVSLYFIDSFINSNPDLTENEYISLAEKELREIGIFDEETEILYRKAKLWNGMGTVVTENYFKFTDEVFNPAEGIFLAGDYTFYEENNPYGLEAAFFSGQKAAQNVLKYLKTLKKNTTNPNKYEFNYSGNNSLEKAVEMFDAKEPLTVCSRYKISDKKPEFFDIFQEGNIAFYALIAQATKNKVLAGKIAGTITEDFEWPYHYGYKTSAFDTSIVLESLMDLELEREKVQKSIESLKNKYYQNEEGCFSIWTLSGIVNSAPYWTGCSADITSHLGWLFYKFDPEKYDKLAKNTAEYVKKAIDQQNFKSKWFPSNILMPYFAARLFKVFGNKYQKQIDIISDFLVLKQKENGSFSDSVLETSYAVLAMKAIENKELLPNIERAEFWLRNNENHYPEPILYYWIDSNTNPGTKIFFSCYDKGLVSEAYKKMALEK